jgi:DNA-binding IclR family transcriptional regulator
MGVHERTARRLLYSLEDEGYLQRGHGTGRQACVYSLTPRLLALAGQLAARLPIVTRGERVVRDYTSGPASMPISSSPATAT